MPFTASLWYKGGFYARKGSIKGRPYAWLYLPDSLLPAAQQELGQLLHQVDEEEAGAEDQLRQELQAQQVRRALQVRPDLRQEVDQRGGQENSAAEAEEE